MSAAEKIGLLPGFGWIADQSWFGDPWWSHMLSTLIVCWTLTPIGHVVWGFVAQATVIPLDSQRQWRSFFPGDLYLGTAVALLIVAAGQSRSDGWWTVWWFHVIVLTATVLVALAITWFVDRPGMPLSALLSPSKLYHNFLLYGGYGYVGVVAVTAAVAGNWFTARLVVVGLALVALTPWVKAVIDDSSLSPAAATDKQQHAHPATYKLFWVIPIRGSYDQR